MRGELSTGCFWVCLLPLTAKHLLFLYTTKSVPVSWPLPAARTLPEGRNYGLLISESSSGAWPGPQHLQIE